VGGCGGGDGGCVSVGGGCGGGGCVGKGATNNNMTQFDYCLLTC
jgi:hypothetical protein